MWCRNEIPDYQLPLSVPELCEECEMILEDEEKDTERSANALVDQFSSEVA